MCAVCSTARCEQFLEVSSRLGDVPQLHQVCQTWARNGPQVSTCAGFVEDYLGVSNRGDLAVLGSVRVYVTKPLARASSTGALTPF